MGLERFEVRFFSGEKFTKFDLAFISHQKSLKSWLHMVHDVFKDMTEEFILGQKSYGNTTRLIIFYTKKKSHLHSEAS